MLICHFHQTLGSKRQTSLVATEIDIEIEAIRGPETITMTSSRCRTIHIGDRIVADATRSLPMQVGKIVPIASILALAGTKDTAMRAVIDTTEEPDASGNIHAIVI